VRAYKFLRKDGRAPLTGFRWPGDGWVEVDGPLEWCVNGIHACRVEDVPHWIGEELWLVELEGETVTVPDAVVGRRGRLVERIDAWSAGVAQDFGESCARRANALATGAPAAAERAGDAAANAARGLVAAAAYIAAAVAGEVASGSRRGVLYQHYFLAERTRQAWWLQDKLGLTDS
jgi:hypothetical protein